MLKTCEKHQTQIARIILSGFVDSLFALNWKSSAVEYRSYLSQFEILNLGLESDSSFVGYYDLQLFISWNQTWKIALL